MHNIFSHTNTPLQLLVIIKISFAVCYKSIYLYNKKGIMAKKKVIDPVVEETIVDNVVIDERTPADKVKEFIAGNGISHIDAIRVGGLSQEEIA